MKTIGIVQGIKHRVLCTGLDQCNCILYIGYFFDGSLAIAPWCIVCRCIHMQIGYRTKIQKIKNILWHLGLFANLAL